MKKVIISIVVAAVLWFVMFSPWTGHCVNFWITMSCSAAILCVISWLVNRNLGKLFHFSLKDVFIGILSAALLWVVFFLGEYFSTMIFDFARTQVDSIYSLKDGENSLMLTLMLLLLVGPAEEIFWRGVIQHSFAAKYGECKALVMTTIVYSLVHIWSFNFMLVMAAMVCGIFWGILYQYNKNITTNIISHAIWDVSVFILFPIM